MNMCSLFTTNNSRLLLRWDKMSKSQHLWMFSLHWTYTNQWQFSGRISVGGRGNTDLRRGRYSAETCVKTKALVPLGARAARPESTNANTCVHFRSELILRERKVHPCNLLCLDGVVANGI